MPTPTKYSYNKEVNSDKLKTEITQSDITTAFDHIDTVGTSLDVWFKDTLSPADNATLDALVAAHDPVSSVATPGPIEVVTQLEKDDKTKKFLAFHATANAGTTEAPTPTSFCLRVPGTLSPIFGAAGLIGFNKSLENDRLVYGGEFWSESGDSRDYIQIDVVDHENALGAGADYILKTYYEDTSTFQVYPDSGTNTIAKKPGIQILPNQKTIIYNASPGHIYAGMWLRLTYWNYSTSPVLAHANINWDKEDA